MKITDEAIIIAVNENKTMLSAANSIPMPFMSFRYRVKKLGLWNPNPSRKGIKRGSYEQQKIRIPLDEILKGLHPHYDTTKLKLRLLKEGIKDERCESPECIITNTWNGKKLVLHLDHIDGNSLNHKLENLQLLCPNCHSQTSTYSGKRKTYKIK